MIEKLRDLVDQLRLAAHHAEAQLEAALASSNAEHVAPRKDTDEEVLQLHEGVIAFESLPRFIPIDRLVPPQTEQEG
jgi:hypothetical protein